LEGLLFNTLSENANEKILKNHPIFLILDVVGILERQNISKVDDFAWMSNLRYYLKKDGDDSLVSHAL
jgi:hypothetical protein